MKRLASMRVFERMVWGAMIWPLALFLFALVVNECVMNWFAPKIYVSDIILDGPFPPPGYENAWLWQYWNGIIWGIWSHYVIPAAVAGWWVHCIWQWRSARVAVIKLKILAGVLALVLFSVACSNPFKGIAEDKSSAYTPHDESCPWDMVPGDLDRCWVLDMSKVRMVREPKSPTVACTIVIGNPHPYEQRLGSVDRDGTVHWFWNEQLLNPHMRDKMKQACLVASAGGFR